MWFGWFLCVVLFIVGLCSAVARCSLICGLARWFRFDSAGIAWSFVDLVAR